CVGRLQALQTAATERGRPSRPLPAVFRTNDKSALRLVFAAAGGPDLQGSLWASLPCAQSVRAALLLRARGAAPALTRKDPHLRARRRALFRSASSRHPVGVSLR